MENDSEKADLKIVDFGLSKIIGPNETSKDPFGTLVSYSINISSHMLHPKFFCKSLMEKKLTYGV